MLRLALLLLPATASAQLLLEESFNTPPADGGWASIAQPVAGVADLATGRLGSGWRVSHPDAGTGVTNRSPCFRKSFDGGNPAVTVRYWLRASSQNDEFGMYPVIIQSPSNTLAEVRFSGVPTSTFTPVLQCADVTGFRTCSSLSPPLLASDVWHLVELQLEGLGTGQGRCRAAINGTTFCTEVTNWTGVQANSAFIGLCAVDESWAGSMIIDELRVGSSLQGTRLRISGPDAGNEGDCLRFTIDTIDTFSRQPAPVAVKTVIDSVVFQGASGFFASNCVSPSGPAELSTNARGWEVYARAGPSDISITASSSDLLPATPFSVHINRADAGRPDAGVPDAGVPDAGVPDAGVPDAGVADASVPDAGLPDAGEPDAGTPDAGTPDAGLTADAGGETFDAGPNGGTGVIATDFEVGCGCTGAPWLQLLACVALLFRRARR